MIARLLLQNTIVTVAMGALLFVYAGTLNAARGPASIRTG